MNCLQANRIFHARSLRCVNLMSLVDLCQFSTSVESYFSANTSLKCTNLKKRVILHGSEVKIFGVFKSINANDVIEIGAYVKLKEDEV